MDFCCHTFLRNPNVVVVASSQLNWLPVILSPTPLTVSHYLTGGSAAQDTEECDAGLVPNILEIIRSADAV